MDSVRLAAVSEPVASTESALAEGGSVPAVPDPHAGPGRAGGSRSNPAARPDPPARVLDRVVASRLDRAAAAVRWGIGWGRDDATATRRASEALRAARQSGTRLGFATGDAWRDSVLADLGLALSALLDDLTPRQAQIAGLLLVEGVRQADVAAALGVSRATVSVAVARARLPAIAAACRAIEALLVAVPSARGVAGDGSPEAAPR